MTIRIFVVGCPRSGTTLLQSVLLSSGSLISFPESHYFYHINTWQGRHAPGIYSQYVTRRWLKGTVWNSPSVRFVGLSQAASKTRFVRMLDDFAVRSQKAGWVEKTPRHLRYIRDIEDAAGGGVRFIHILRNPKDTIASLFDASRQWGKGLSLQDSIVRWIESAGISAAYAYNPAHLLVRYEDLIEQPEQVLARIGAFAGLVFPPTAQIDLGKYATDIVRETESWKSRNRDSVMSNEAGRTFREKLDPQQQSEVRRTLATFTGLIEDMDLA